MVRWPVAAAAAVALGTAGGAALAARAAPARHRPPADLTGGERTGAAEPLPPAAARALALPGVRWHRRATAHADLYVRVGSAAEWLLDELPGDVERAIAADRAWLGAAGAEPRIRLFFVGAREEMRPLVGWTPAGYAEVGEGTAFLVASPGVRPALRHEIMHLLSWRRWGRPGGLWLSEGVATLAAGACGGLAVDDVAAVLLRERALPSLDTLRRAFDVRGRTGAVQYLASASLVQHVDRAYGRPALRALWTAGLRDARGALGVDARTLERGWRADLAARPTPAVTWAGLWTAIGARGCE